MVIFITKPMQNYAPVLIFGKFVDSRNFSKVPHRPMQRRLPQQ